MASEYARRERLQLQGDWMTNAKRASQQFNGYPQQQLGKTSSHLQSLDSVACENTPPPTPPTPRPTRTKPKKTPHHKIIQIINK